MTLSKSQYIRGLQCHKSLWLYKHKPELRDASDTQKESLFNTGYQVGDLARALFADGVEIEFDAHNFDGMIQKTKELITNGVEVIYEATFKENGVFAMADILVKNKETNLWDIYEVKGATEVKEHYLHDASIQWYALSHAIELGRAYIVHINNKYVRNHQAASMKYKKASVLNDFTVDKKMLSTQRFKLLQEGLDIDQLFTIEDITDEVLSKQGEIPLQLAQMQEMLKGDMPDIDIGKHCDNPYECDFSEHCWRHIPKQNSVFDLAYARGKQWELYYKGILNIDDIADDFHLGENARLQVTYHKSQEIKIDKPKIKEFLDTIKYPINFFDFETFQNAIPRFDNQRPYAQMPFQYSLHILHEDGTLEHKEFLGDENSDPRRVLSEQMLKDITPKGSIVVYNQSFEKTQIRNLAQLYSDLQEQLLALNDRVIDLAHPFQYKYYYHPKFNGRYSIKVVLPTLFPNDDELDYKKLGTIQNGGDAMDTFASLHLLKDESKLDEIKKDLLAYCRLDTLAMVRIWEKLHALFKTKTHIVEKEKMNMQKKEIIRKRVVGSEAIQNSDAWLEWRKHFRTASQASVVLEISPWETPEEMKKKELGLLPKTKISKAMQTGIDREDEVRKKAQDYFNKEFSAQCWEYGRYGASLDGIDAEGQTVVELKVSKYTYFTLKKGNIPENYKIQIMQQLMCSGAEVGYIVAMNPENNEIVVSSAIKLEEDFYSKLEDAWSKYDALDIGNSNI